MEATPREVLIYATPDGREPKLRSFHDWLIESLKDPKEAEAYLKAALSENDPDLLQKAIKDVIEAGNNSVVVALASDTGKLTLSGLTSINT